MRFASSGAWKWIVKRRFNFEDAYSYFISSFFYLCVCESGKCNPSYEYSPYIIFFFLAGFV